MANDKNIAFGRRASTWHTFLSFPHLTIAPCCGCRVSWADFSFGVGNAGSPRQGIPRGRDSRSPVLAGAGPARPLCAVSSTGRPPARRAGRTNPPRQPGLPRRFSRRI